LRYFHKIIHGDEFSENSTLVVIIKINYRSQNNNSVSTDGLLTMIGFSLSTNKHMYICFRIFYRYNLVSSLIFAELHARASIRLREIALMPGRPLYYNSFSYGVGAGFRLPAPFLWCVEFYGSLAKPAAEAQAAWSGPVLFRIFVEYSL